MAAKSIGPASEPFDDPSKRPVFPQQRLQIDLMLLRSVERSIFSLQLRLHSTQYLEIAPQLSRKLGNMLSFELADLSLLRGQALPG